MNIHEFGRGNERRILLIHPSVVTWEYFDRAVPLLEKEFHLLVPALPGYDFTDDSDFTSVEEIASQLADHLIDRGIGEADLIYGCSMGGSIALRMAVDGKLSVRHFVMDGGITPYSLPYLLTRLIALRDFCMLAAAKLGGEKLIFRVLHSEQYGEEDLGYIASVFKHCSYTTLWRSFDSCNNYKMPEGTLRFDAKLHYWHAEKEKKARDWDLKYMKRVVPDTVFREFEGMDHGELAIFHADLFAEAIRSILAS